MHQGALQVLREIVAGLPQFSADQQEVCRRCALGECTKAKWIDRDPQAPDSQQDLAEGAISQVAGGPSTVTAETPGSGESQVTGSGTQGTGISPIPGAGARVTGQGTKGSTGSSTGASATGACTELQGTGVVPAHSFSSGTGHAEEQQTADVVSQSVVSRCRRPKWSQGILRDERDVGEPKKILRRGKAPERLSCYVASSTSSTHSESSSSMRAVDQRGWRDAVMEYNSVMRGEVQEVVSKLERESRLTSRWIIAEHVLRNATGTVEQRLHDIRVDAAMQLELASTGDDVANTLTESILKGKRERFQDLMGVMGDTSLGKREC